MSKGVFGERALESIKDRGFGLCQRCFRAEGCQAHHRRPRGAGGTSDPLAGHPANGLYLCYRCHAWIESHRSCALDLGLLVPQGLDPRLVSVWLRLPYGEAWWRLHDDGTFSMDHELERPREGCLVA